MKIIGSTQTLLTTKTQGEMKNAQRTFGRISFFAMLIWICYNLYFAALLCGWING